MMLTVPLSMHQKDILIGLSLIHQFLKMKKKKSPRRGIEPRSPAWQAGILTTILTRMIYYNVRNSESVSAMHTCLRRTSVWTTSIRKLDSTLHKIAGENSRKTLEFFFFSFFALYHFWMGWNRGFTACENTTVIILFVEPTSSRCKPTRAWIMSLNTKSEQHER